VNGGAALRLPHPTKPGASATWDGEKFDLGGESVRVLAYEVSPSGWNDELTRLHEETAGSDHFIDVASREYALAEAIGAVRRPDSVVMEIGVSSGFLLADLEARLPDHRVIGADYTHDTLESLGQRMRSVPLVQFDLTRCPLPEGFADVVVALNVLEHIPDDKAAVAELFRILRPGGTAIIEVPAGAKLFDVYDRALMHFRRYDMAGLAALFEDAGFAVESKSHLGAMLYPAFYLSKRLNQLRHSNADFKLAQKVAEQQIAATKSGGGLLGRTLMHIEDALRPYVNYPVGVRCLLKAVKPVSVAGG
jgi:SAM-dependent methyltransferase